MPEDTLINFEHRVSNLEGESLRDGKDALTRLLVVCCWAYVDGIAIAKLVFSLLVIASFVYF
jgi:hypothetical protein